MCIRDRFLDDCAGHPTPMGQYHYHALPKCVTATVDETDGASHIIGIAFDGLSLIHISEPTRPY